MIYKEKQYKEIFKKMLQDAFENNLISYDSEFADRIENREDISNFYTMLLSIHAEAIEEVYTEMTNVYNSSKVNYAEGVDLDDIGLIVNCPRPEATCACVELLFSSNHEYGEIVSEPAGILVRTNNKIVYRTIEPLEFTPESNSCLVQAVAVDAGSQSHVSADTLKKIDSDLMNVGYVSVTNPEASTGGADGFTDEQYRELLKNWVKSKQRGNEWAYSDYFARLDGLEDYKVVPNWDGAGTIKCIVTPSNSYFLNKVYNELQSDVTQASEDIVVVAPVNRPVDIYIYCNVDIDRVNPYSSNEKDVIKSKVEVAVNEYISNMGIGEDLIPFKLGAYLDKQIVELKNIEFNYPTKPVTITDEEKCSLGELEIIME